MPTQLRLWEKTASQGDKGDSDVSSEGEGSWQEWTQGQRSGGCFRGAYEDRVLALGVGRRCWLWDIYYDLRISGYISGIAS